jgi:hypothetical protein
MKKKEEVLVIDPNNVPEFITAQKEQVELVKANPFIEITNTKTHEQAKVNRTALRSGRVKIQGAERIIASKIRQFRDKVKIKAASLVDISIVAETKQQLELDRYEQVKKERKAEKERIKKQQVEAWIKKSSEILDILVSISKVETVDEVVEIQKHINSLVVNKTVYGDYLLVAEQNLAQVKEVAQRRYNGLIELEQKAEEQKVNDLVNARVAYRKLFHKEASEALEAETINNMIKKQHQQDKDKLEAIAKKEIEDKVEKSVPIKLTEGRSVPQGPPKEKPNEISQVEIESVQMWISDLKRLRDYRPININDINMSEDINKVVGLLDESVKVMQKYQF